MKKCDVKYDYITKISVPNLENLPVKTILETF